MSLAVQDIEQMKRDFPVSSSSFFQRMMQQTKDMLRDHLSVQMKKERTFTVKRWRLGGGNMQEERNLQERNMREVFKMIKYKKLTGKSKDYSNLDWTEMSNSTSRLSLSKDLEEAKPSLLRRKTFTPKSSSNITTPYTHKKFFEELEAVSKTKEP